MEKILVDGVMGDRRGRPLWLRRARSQEGQIAVGEKVVIAWGKSKRTFNAKVIDVGDGVHSPEIPRQDTSNGKCLHLNWWTQHSQLGPSISQAHRSLYSGHKRKTVALLCSLTTFITLHTPCP